MKFYNNLFRMSMKKGFEYCFCKTYFFFLYFYASINKKMTIFNTYKQCKSTVVRHNRYRAIYVF